MPCSSSSMAAVLVLGPGLCKSCCNRSFLAVAIHLHVQTIMAATHAVLHRASYAQHIGAYLYAPPAALIQLIQKPVRFCIVSTH